MIFSESSKNTINKIDLILHLTFELAKNATHNGTRAHFHGDIIARKSYLTLCMNLRTRTPLAATSQDSRITLPVSARQQQRNAHTKLYCVLYRSFGSCALIGIEQHKSLHKLKPRLFVFRHLCSQD